MLDEEEVHLYAIISSLFIFRSKVGASILVCDLF